jgi:hypothetical protein
MADPIFAVVGETIELYIEAEDHFEGTVTVSFVASVVDEAAKVEDLVLFDETLTAKATTVRTPNAPPEVRASVIAWKVNVAKDERFRGRTATLSFTVEGAGLRDGTPVHAVSTNELQIVSIGVTTNPACLRIMLHEFPNDDLGVPIVDRERLFEEVEKLTPAQRRLLLAHAKASPEGRLVVFLTRIPSGDRRMRADFGGGTESAIPNASFAVFACRDLAKDGISLVCFTEHFLINTKNGSTQLLLASRQDGKPPSEWRSRDNPSPPRFCIASQQPGPDNDGVIWSCIYAANGKNVMKRNTMHGIINTIGCWMLFRNYNWPRDKAREFERVFIRGRQLQGAGASVGAIRKARQAMLTPLGYDVLEATATETNSMTKFAGFDRNFAYLWFFHDIVGVKYFSKLWEFGGPLPINNDFDVAGLNFRKTFPVSEIGKPTPTNTPDELGCTMHSFKNQLRGPDGKPMFKLDDSLLRPNVLGFQTTKKFIPQHARYGDMSAAELKDCAWADLYLYDNL